MKSNAVHSTGLQTMYVGTYLPSYYLDCRVCDEDDGEIRGNLPPQVYRICVHQILERALFKKQFCSNDNELVFSGIRIFSQIPYDVRRSDFSTSF